MKTLLACTLTAVVTAGVITGIGIAGRAGARSGPVCGPRTEGTGFQTHHVYVCTLRTLPAPGQQSFELRLPSIDVLCTPFGGDASSNVPPFLACERLSLSSLKCVDGVFGSWTAEISARRIEVDSPQPCKTQAKPPGYKLTGGYTPHVYYRNP
jgi:hypothetical protein